MDDMTLHRKRRLQALIAGKPFNGSQQAFATATGLSEGRITQLLDPGDAFGERAAKNLAGRLGLEDERYFEADFSAATPEPAPISFSVPRAVSVSPTAGVPVVGTARLGDEGHYYELEYPVGHGDGVVLFPSRDQNAYAVRCKGESMAPRIRHGEYAIVEPNHAVLPGDEVLVRSKDGRVMIKVLAFSRDGMVHLDSINNSHHTYPRISLPEEEVAAMHYVAATAKSALWAEASAQHPEPVPVPPPYVGKGIAPLTPAKAAKSKKAG